MNTSIDKLLPLFRQKTREEQEQKIPYQNPNRKG